MVSTKQNMMSALNPFPQQVFSLMSTSAFRDLSPQNLKVILILKHYERWQIQYWWQSVKQHEFHFICARATSPVTYLGSISPWRGNKLAAANSPLVSSLPLTQCLPEWLAARNPRSHCFTYWTSHVFKCKLWSAHTHAWTSNVTFFSDIRTPQLPDWHYSNIYPSAESLT